MDATKPEQKSFSSIDKDRAIECARHHGPTAGAKLIGAHPSTVSHWLAQRGLTQDRRQLGEGDHVRHDRTILLSRAKIEKLLVKATILNLEDSLKSATSAKDRQALAMATGINLDKLAMLRGELKPGTAPSAESRRAMLQSGRERSAKLRAV